jgi:L-proline---[L-prolyl-carrier protein] ligase
MLRPRELVRKMHEWRITLTYAVPSTISLLESDGGLREHPLPHLTRVLYAGEPFPVSRLRSVMECIPQAQFYNLFGPTETNVCTYHALASVPDERCRQISIGRACEHLTVDSLDENANPVSPGSEGELCVAGPTVIAEYFRRPGATQGAFFDAARFADGRARYRTGDRVSIDGEGLFWFHGRRDRMIKRRGYRVELGEIEAVLDTHATVLEVAVFPHCAGNDMHMVAAVVPRPGTGATPLTLKAHCGRLLPSYMVPDTILILESLPRTENGKVDLQRLAANYAVWIMVDVWLMVTDLVRAFLIREFFRGEALDSLSDEQPLVTSGLLDSVATLKLVLYLEEQFNISIDSVDISDGQLDTLRSIESLVTSKRATLASG